MSPVKAEEKTKAEAKPKSREQQLIDSGKEVTFVWNRDSKFRVLTLTPATTVMSPAGPIQGKPGIRIKVKNGVYKTKDPEEIKALMSLPDFESQGLDGFRIPKEMDPEEQIKQLAKAGNIDLKKLAEE